ncbi:hypothetical protein LINGRAHAP2_LOCUS29154 [Linum grandiflorum]
MTNNQRKRKMDVLTNLTSSSKRMLSTPPDCITISSDLDSSDYEDEFRKDRYWFDWSKKKDNLARYIFGRRRDMKEVLVQQDDIECDRAAIRSLIPGTKMDAKVITSVCRQQTYIEMMLKGNIRKGGPLCFLPASLQDAAMKGLKPEKAFSDYQFSYLEAAGNCQEVYIPMCDDRHWYLMVVSILKKEVHISDCLSKGADYKCPYTAIDFMMTFTTELFKVVYANCGKTDTSPPIRDFPLKLTKVVLEPSTDSGLWVCSSIVLETIVSSGWEIQPYRLMNQKELAVYLVTGYANMKRNEVLMRAERLSKKKVVRHLEFNG